MKDVIGSKGMIFNRAYRCGRLVSEDQFPNTVLRSGRRYLAASMGGNLLGSSHDAFITHMAFGTGGMDGGSNRIPVPDTVTTFVGGVSNIRDVVPVQCVMAQGNTPGLTVVGTLPSTANSNGQQITQVGLKMANGEFYAISTWPGFYKDTMIYDTLEWTLIWL